VKTYRIAAPFLLALGLSCFAQSGAGRMGVPANTAPDTVAAITVEEAVT